MLRQSSKQNQQQDQQKRPEQEKFTAKKVRQGAFFVADQTVTVLKAIEDINDPYGACKAAMLVRILLETVVLARANSKQLNYLARRTKVVTPILKRISEAPKSKLNVEAALELFNDVVNACTDEANKYTEKNIVLRLLQTGINKEKFAELNTRLTDAMAALTLALGAEATVMLEQQITKNDEEFEKIQEEDKQEILEHQGEIFKQLKEFLEQKQSQTNTGSEDRNHNNENILSQQERDNILVLQIQSAIAALAGNLALNPAEKNNFLRNEYKQLQQEKHFLNIHTNAPQSRPPIDSKLLIPFYDIEVQQKIAQGSFGTIYQGSWYHTPVVVKKVCGENSKKEDFEQFVREVRIMADLRYPHITQFLGACLEPDACIIMEYMEQGSMDKLLQRKKLGHEEQRNTALDVAKGLLYLHSRGVLHRHLKTSNILINAQGQAKLTDFGLSKTLDQSIKTSLGQSDAIQWMAPETFLTDKRYSTASDVYSFGMVLWSICTGKKPFEGLSEIEITTRIAQGNPEKIDDDIPLEFQKIIKCCWSKLPIDRPHLSDIIKILKTMEIQKQLSPAELFEQGKVFQKNKDLVSAEKCYLLAIENGIFPAQTKVAMLYLEQGNKQGAYKMLLQAANNKEKQAQFNLARMLEKGDGVEKDIPQALYWYKEAEKQGVTEATPKIKILEKQIQNAEKSTTIQNKNF